MKKDVVVELVFLIALFGGLLYIGPGEVFQHELSHEKPVQFGATDGFLYAMLSEHVYETGNFRHNPFYSTAGFDDSTAYHPPLLMHITSAFAHLSGLNAYDALSLLMGLFVLFGAFMIYWLVRSWNKKIALLGASVFVFLYVTKFVIGYVWGEALLMLGTFFLVALFFLMSKNELRPWWVPAGILIAATINAHTSETIFFYGFAIFFIGMKFLFRQLTKKDLKFWAKQLGLATLLAIILSMNYLIIFYHGYYQITGKSYTSLKPMSPEEFGAIKVPTLQDFRNPVLYAILIGAVLAVVLARKKAHTALLACGFMFLVGMTNYIGLHYRAFQTRFLWPLYLALFFGITLYFVLKFVPLRKNLVIPSLVSLVLAGVFVHAYYQPVHPDIIYDGQWQGFKWLEQNTPERARILFFYGDGYSQSLRLIKRLVFLSNPSDLAAAAQEEPRRRMLQIEPILQNEMQLIYRKGLFDFGYYAKEQNITIHTAPMDVCGFDYYVFDKRSGYAPQLIQAGLNYANIMLAHNITGVYQNDHLVILKNNNVGGECLA